MTIDTEFAERNRAKAGASSAHSKRFARFGCNRAVWRALLVCAVLLVVVAWLALRLVPLPPALFESADSDGAERRSPTRRDPVDLARAGSETGAPSLGSVEFLDKDGRTLRETADTRNYFTKRVSYGEIPQPLIHATLAAEDKRFWKHPGIDWRGTVRAALGLVRHGRVVSGGSTITQQLIKMAEPRPRTVRTKLIESVQALRLEQIWSKERILAEYLNRLDYGNLHAGCAAASEFYFQKPLRDLSAAEAALLAGLPQAPTRLNPHLHFDRARKRQQWILQRMVQEGYLNPEDFTRATEEPLRLASPKRIFQAPHFVDLVVQSVANGSWSRGDGRWPLPEPLNRRHPSPSPLNPDSESGGVRGEAVPVIDQFMERQTSIHTTLDLPLNQFTEQALRNHLSRLQPQHPLNGAVVVIENRTGNVLALVGSENYFAPAAGQVNGTWAARSAGSTFKPFTYLLAFEQGASPASVVADVPVEFSTATGVFRPVNYNHRCYGPMRYRLALANSLNISAVKVLALAGGPAVLQQRLQECGLTTLNQPSEFYGLGLTIGNAEARLLELANAYACLARLGVFRPYRLVQRGDGWDRADKWEGRRVFDNAAAYLIADILSDNSARTLAFGAESELRFDFPVACKTGTSSDFRDNWALGYTPEFTVGVWVGNFDGSPMEHVSGVTGAAPILHELFVHLHERYGTSWYAPPQNIVVKMIHPITGKRLTQAGAGLSEKFIDGHFPALEGPEDIDSTGRVRLSPEYHDWFASGDNWLAGRAVLESSPSLAALQLVSPLPGTTYYLDPDLPPSSRRILLKASGAGALSWESESLRCQCEADGTFAILAEGQHRLRVRDRETGAALETWIIVKAL